MIIFTIEFLFYVLPVLIGVVFALLFFASRKNPENKALVVWKKIFMVLFIVGILAMVVWQVYTFITVLILSQAVEGKFADFILNLVLYTLPTITICLFVGLLLLRKKYPENRIINVLSTIAILLMSVSLSLSFLYHGFVMLVLIGM